jgi:4-hydroxy-tetrahydrodipicolinate synthase
MRDLCAAALDGNVPKVRELNARLARLNKALFVEANPIPVKWALAELGRSALGYRLPLVELGAQHHATVRAALQDAGLL